MRECVCVAHINDGKGRRYIPSYISEGIIYGIIMEVDVVVFLFSFLSLQDHLLDEDLPFHQEPR